MHPRPRPLLLLLFVSCATLLCAQGTRLLRQPDLTADGIAFVYGADIWTADRDGRNVRRITSTPAVEGNPRFSPDGRRIAFTSNRDGSEDVYVVDRAGGIPTRLTWHPASDAVRGWTADGSRILFASTRDAAPVAFNRLWTIDPDGGPAEMLSEQWGL